MTQKKTIFSHLKSLKLLKNKATVVKNAMVAFSMLCKLQASKKE